MNPIRVSIIVATCLRVLKGAIRAVKRRGIGTAIHLRKIYLCSPVVVCGRLLSVYQVQAVGDVGRPTPVILIERNTIERLKLHEPNPVWGSPQRITKSVELFVLPCGR